MHPVSQVALAAAVVCCSAGVSANPIPLPIPASMPLEEMLIKVRSSGEVTFSGNFTFDFIPADVTKMQFPLAPANGAAVSVFQDGNPVAWTMSADVYPTVLPEFPSIPMFEWEGPFPTAGAQFGVEYEHEVFARGATQVLFYSLGTGKYFRTYDKTTTALFDILLPSSSALLEVLLDDTPIDPSSYSFANGRLDLALDSEFGPFTRDLIVIFREVPAPASLVLLALGLLPILAASIRRPGH